MKKLKKAAVAFLAMFAFILACGCGEEESSNEYEHLKTDIIGVWMTEGGPSVSEDNPFGTSLMFFEFGSDKCYHHFVHMNEQGIPADGTNSGQPYHIKDNMYVNDNDNTGAYIEINGDTMTMSNNSGSTVYKKLSIADATGYYVSCVDETLRSQQRELLGIDDPVTESAESENTGENADTSETSESDNTEGNADVSDTEAAESVS